MTSPYEDWWDNYAFPLHAAVDEANDLPPDTPLEKRLALIVEKCPWVREKFGPGPSDATMQFDGDWIEVESSNVAAYKIDVQPENGMTTVSIRFKSGGVYSYADVPMEVASKIETADSIGKWVNATLVSGGYTSTRIE